jgi:site-specific DNA-methyltransferase (adenine-specific)
VKPYYEDGLVTLYHGDCREWMPIAAADALVTDPPYGLDAVYGRPGGLRRTIQGDATTDLLSWVAGRSQWLLPDAWAAVFCGWNGNAVAANAMEDAGLTVKTVIVWDKLQPGIGTGIRDQHEFIVLGHRGDPPRPWHGGNVWRFPKVHGQPAHPNEKPLALMRALIARLTAGNALIVDPFAGSGSTLEAAKSLGRRAIGIEIEERYCEIAAQRCSQEVLGLVG